MWPHINTHFLNGIWLLWLPMEGAGGVFPDGLERLDFDPADMHLRLTLTSGKLAKPSTLRGGGSILRAAPH